MTRPALLLAGLTLVLSGCGSDPAPAGQPALPRVPATVGGVRLDVEVAGTQEQKEAGLRGRDVPRGTGMAFPYPEVRVVRFTMSGVDRPLAAVFARAGRVLTVEALVPCAGSVADCPTYGPDEPVDVVVETAEGGFDGVRPGDPVSVG